MKKGIFIATAVILALAYSCSQNFLETKPLGVASEDVFHNAKGVNALLTGAYAMIDGAGAGGWGGSYAWSGSVTNWVWGSVASDDAYKGSSYGDQITINPVERYEALPTNGYVSDKWTADYDGVSRVNDCLTVLNKTVKENNISQAEADEFKAEALFLRAWFHFELKRVFNNIPYITEDVEDPGTVSNTVDAWPLIENDMKFAIDHLPETQQDVGRPTKYAAEAVMARIKLFQHKYGEAKPLLDDILNSGKYHLAYSYHDNYKIATNNNEESIFEIQYAVNDGTSDSFNGGYGDCLNFPHGADIGTCCGFHQASQDFVNAFKVDHSGLPLLDTYNDTNLVNDMGIASADSFVPASHLVDPRLDWSVGRRGIPYLDWGIDRGKDWIRDQPNGGPYLPIKNMFYKSEKNTLSTTTGWATGVNANNYRAYRLAHIMLWRAEVAVEENDLPTALTLVNQIRERASHEVVMGRCYTYKLPPGVTADVHWDEPAANYLVKPYSSFPNQDFARKAVRMEERLEYGTEGHRFFDLVRWGIADQVLNAYIAQDSKFRSFMQGAHFTKGTNEYWPIPQNQIDIEGKDVLQQNPGF